MKNPLGCVIAGNGLLLMASAANICFLLFELWLNATLTTAPTSIDPTAIMMTFNIVPIPGLVSQIFVEVGDSVAKGQKLFILEAMKMENEIKSNQDGIIKNIYIKEGMNINKDQIMMEIKING